MYLRSLTLKGFKSFADTTTLELEPGITVVVGPNGSGKSNLVDAVAWVLGAQGPRTVRSSRMDDVIFAGAGQRAALGRTEVSLTIDNASGTLPVELTEVTISRTLFRSGESEYALNRVPCRLLDLQELLSDSGVGRTQHLIVGQGQLDAVLDSRPEDRRAVVEEAAGVLKFRRRKEKAERRLQATEESLVRLTDVLRELRRQLRPLERQAEATRRHDDLAAELAAVRRHVAGRELAARSARLERASAELADLSAGEVDARADLARLDAEVLSAEDELAAMGAEDLSDVLVRVERLRAQGHGLAALLGERLRGIERERRSLVDQAVVATLEAEAARHRAELAVAEAAAELLVPEAGRLAEAEAVLAAARATFEAQGSDDGLASNARRVAEARGQLAALRTGLARGDGEVARTAPRLEAVTAKRQRLAAEMTRLAAEAAQAASRREAAAAELAATGRRRVQLEVSAAEAAAGLRWAVAERHTWSARAEALALARADARAAADHVAGMGGVLDSLSELVEVDRGWEAAFGAAVGDALAAVVVDGGNDVAPGILAELHGNGPAGVLPLGIWPHPAAAPCMGEPLRPHVRARRPDVGALLDVLVGSVTCVGGPAGEGEPAWRAALDAAAAHPAAVVVTREGDRFAAGGWRLAAAGAGAVGLALEEAIQQAAAAGEAAGTAEDAAATLEAELADVRVAEDDLARRTREAEAGMAAIASALTRAQSEEAEVASEVLALTGQLAELGRHAAGERARSEVLESELPALEAEEAAGEERGRARRAERSRLEERAVAVATLRTDLEVRVGGIEERQGYLRRRLAEVEERLAGSAPERAQAEDRRVELDRRQVATEGLARFVAERGAWVEVELDELRDRRRRQSEASRAVASRLEALRTRRTGAERDLEGLRERARRAELETQELRLRVEATVEGIRRDLECEPEVALAAQCPLLPEGTTAPDRSRQFERELRLLGPVNPLALEEHAALQERLGFLDGQLTDVRSSRRELAKVIRAVDAEIVSLFSAAFADAAAHFGALFEVLFPGGHGELRLTDPGDLLRTGVEVEARPSGKSVRKLSLLSGGERALTALGFLFAVYRSRPSPFYVLDEVDAALDDVNLCRFLDLVREWRGQAQLLIVTHQKRTMEVGDVLYGVSVPPGGSSRVVSERVAALA